MILNNCYPYFEFEIDDIKEKLDYPVVIKSSLKHGAGISICKSSEELEKNYSEMQP